MKFTYGIKELEFDDPSQYPTSEPIEKLQAMDRAADGTLQVESLGLNIKTRVLFFEGMSKLDYEGLKDWFDNVANGAVNKFEFKDEFNELYTVRIISSIFDFKLTSYELYTGTLELEYV